MNFDKGDVIAERYTICDTFGEGAFGTVFKVRDEETGEYMALKKSISLEASKKFGNREEKMLKDLAELDPEKKNFFLHLSSSFTFCGFKCLLFDIMGPNIHDFLKFNNFQPFPMPQVMHIAWQLCSAVQFLHANRIRHTDLKTDNVVFISGNYVEKYWKNVLKSSHIRLIDFGGAIYESDDPTIIVLQFYRAPELVLELPISYPMDVWAVGCILFELYYGTMLFHGENDEEHLAQMERVLGKIPERMAKRTQIPLFENGKLIIGSSAEFACRPYKKLRRSMRSLEPEHVELFELIEEMLVYEPVSRITMEEVVKHRYFRRLEDEMRVQGIPEPVPPVPRIASSADTLPVSRKRHRPTD